MGKHKHTPKPVTRKEQHQRKTRKAVSDLLGIAQKAKNVTEKRRAAQSELAVDGEIYKMIMEDDKGLNKANHPFINSFNGLKGINSPPYTERSQQIQNMINTREKHLKNRSNIHKNLKKIRQSFVERKTSVDTRDKEFKHPYEKHTRRPKKRPTVKSSIQTRSMKRHSNKQDEFLALFRKPQETQPQPQPPVLETMTKPKPKPVPKYRGRKPKTIYEDVSL
jgi:hypothetical protein